MEDKIALQVTNLTKDFRLPHEQRNSLKEKVLNFNRKTTFEKLHALKGITFDVKRGEFFGIVGRNGSGKSTLLKLIGGIYQPSRGNIVVNGTLTPFIELGIGFNPELTGRENVYLNGAILGLTHKQVESKYQEIVDFAELEQFMDQKLKNYSSGMQVRLAFSIAIQAHNDILLIDEVLAVGDASFQRKCFETFKSIKQSGKTVIFVSHDMGAVREYCERAILIEKGKIISSGDPDTVANDYLQLLSTNNIHSEDREANRWGDLKAKISHIEIKVGNEKITIEYDIHAGVDMINPIFGIAIKDLDNHHLFDTNTKWKKVATGTIKKGSRRHFTCQIPNVFKSGRYRLSVAAAYEDALSFYDWQEAVDVFDVTRPEETAGLVVLSDKITVTEV